MMGCFLRVGDTLPCGLHGVAVPEQFSHQPITKANPAPDPSQSWHADRVADCFVSRAVCREFLAWIRDEGVIVIETHEPLPFFWSEAPDCVSEGLDITGASVILPASALSQRNCDSPATVRMAFIVRSGTEGRSEFAGIVARLLGVETNQRASASSSVFRCVEAISAQGMRDYKLRFPCVLVAVVVRTGERRYDEGFLERVIRMAASADSLDHHRDN